MEDDFYLFLFNIILYIEVIFIYSCISCSDLKKVIGNVKIIDIREEYLYKIGSIPTAINIPYKYLNLDASKYLCKDKLYYIYCSFGFKSSKLCYKLSKDGYHVINVLGGYSDFNQKIN